MRVIEEKDFKKFFPNGTLGSESYYEIGDYLLTYNPEYDNGDPHCECDDNVVLTMKNINEPIPFKIIQLIFENFDYESISFPRFGGKLENFGVKLVSNNDILKNKKKVYRIFIELYSLKYLEFIVNILKDEQQHT